MAGVRLWIERSSIFIRAKGDISYDSWTLLQKGGEFMTIPWGRSFDMLNNIKYTDTARFIDLWKEGSDVIIAWPTHRAPHGGPHDVLQMFKWDGYYLTQIAIINRFNRPSDIQTWDDNGDRLILFPGNWGVALYKWDGESITLLGGTSAAASGYAYGWYQAGTLMVGVSTESLYETPSTAYFDLFEWTGSSFTHKATHSVTHGESQSTGNGKVYGWEDGAYSKILWGHRGPAWDTGAAIMFLEWDGTNLIEQYFHVFEGSGSSVGKPYSWKRNNQRFISFDIGGHLKCFSWDEESLSLVELSSIAPPAGGVGCYGVVEVGDDLYFGAVSYSNTGCYVQLYKWDGELLSLSQVSILKESYTTSTNDAALILDGDDPQRDNFYLANSHNTNMTLYSYGDNPPGPPILLLQQNDVPIEVTWSYNL